MQHAGIVGDLVVSEQEEAHVHALHNWPQPSHGCSNAHSHECILCRHADQRWLRLSWSEYYCMLIFESSPREERIAHIEVGV